MVNDINKENRAHPVDVHVGSKLRERRKALGVSQDELARSVDLTFQQVQKYEKGLNRISCSKLHDFAKFLKADIKFFFHGLDDAIYGMYDSDSAMADSAGAESNVEAAELLKSFQNIQDRKLRMTILHLVQALAWK